MHKPDKTYSLHQQIKLVQQQMADEFALQQLQKSKVRELLIERLTSWPVLLGAAGTGLLLSHAGCRNSATATAASPAESTTNKTMSEQLTEPAAATELTAYWRTLLSLPLFTQGIWWLAEQVWHSGLFRTAVRQKLHKSAARQPPY